MANPPKSDRHAAHQRRMAEKKTARQGGEATPSAMSGLLTRYRRLTSLQRRTIQITAGLTVSGAVLIGMHVLNSKNRYCFLPVGPAPTHAYIGATLSFDNATNIDFTIVAKKLSDSLNEALEKALLLDTYHVKDTSTGKVVGSVAAYVYTPIDVASPPAYKIPNHGFIRMEIRGKEYKLPTDARFTVSPNLRTIKIDKYEIDSSDIIENRRLPGDPKNGFGTMVVRPMFVHVTRGTPECSSTKP